MGRVYAVLIAAPLAMVHAGAADADDYYGRGLSWDSLQSSSAVDRLDRGYLHVDVGWGDLEVGRTDGVRQRLVPTGASMLAPSLRDGGAKLAYYAPDLYGLRLGVSYAPLPRGEAAEPDPLTTRHMMEAAVTRMISIGRARAKLSAGASRAQVRPDSWLVPKRSWIVGAQVAWDEFRIAADLRERLTAAGDTMRSWSSGVAWLADAWKLKLQMNRSWTGAQEGVDRLRADASYSLNPHWQIRADAGRTDDGCRVDTIVKLATRIAF